MEELTPFIIWLNKNDLDKLLTLMIENSCKKDEVLTRAEMDNYCEKLIEINNQMCDVLKNIEPLKSIAPSDIVTYRYHDGCKNIQQINEIRKHCGKHHPDLKSVENKLIEVLECKNCNHHNSNKISLKDFENKYKPNNNK
ncbi:hypothetical protein FLAV_02467 [Flavobacteriales bacterium]|nr:hypothetical protein FLAV_02467 [Flavobacteriales bacterium]